MSTALPAVVSLAWRPETAWLIERARPALGFTEVIAENICPDRELPRPLAALTERAVPIVPHGVSLSLGSADGIDPTRLDRLARVAERVGAPLVSEHVAFVRGGGVEVDHLLPVPRRRAMLDIVVANVRRAMEVLPVPLAIENIARLFAWPDDDMSEGEFLAELLTRTDALLLLDLSNLYGNAKNHGDDPAAFLDRLPLDRIAYVHVAGGAWLAGFYNDSHAHPIGDASLALVSDLVARTGPVPILLERDDSFGTRAALEAEILAIRTAVSAATSGAASGSAAVVASGAASVVASGAGAGQGGRARRAV